MSDAYRVALTALGKRPDISPFDALTRWEAFVDQCAVLGYDEPDYEFYNDRDIRGHLDVLTTLMDTQPGLFDSGTTRTLRHRITSADETWWTNVQPDPRARPDDPWWAQFVPTHVAGDFADDLSRTRAVMTQAWGDPETRPLRPLFPLDYDAEHDKTLVEAALRPFAGQMSPLLRERMADYMAACNCPDPKAMYWMDGGTPDLLDGRFTTYGPDGWLTDGLYRWRPVLADYVRHHGLGLPADLIEHARSHDWAAPNPTPEQSASLTARISADRTPDSVRVVLCLLAEPNTLARFESGWGDIEAVEALRWFDAETQRADEAAWEEQEGVVAASKPTDAGYLRLFARARALNAAALLLRGDSERALYEAQHARPPSLRP